MNKLNQFLSATAVLTGSTCLTLAIQLPASANDQSVLCSNRNMATEVALSTESFYAAICSTGEYDLESGCYLATEYFYVGQSRNAGNSIVVPVTSVDYADDPRVTTFRARNGDYTYQIATSGAYNMTPWMSLSVFYNDGGTAYSRKVNHYYGYWDC